MSRVLVLDNEAGRLTALASSLTNVGIDVQSADCVISALEYARKQPYDLLLCADRLQDLDAIDLLEIRQGYERFRELPVAVVATSNKNKLECFRLGCDEFVVLPMDDAELLFRICALLRRAPKRGVSGSFSDLNLIDVIQLLIGARRSGELKVFTEHQSGVLFFVSGQVVHAESDSERGEEAVRKILRVSRYDGGSFLFTSTSPWAGNVTVEKRTDHLLLELANEIDEGA